MESYAFTALDSRQYSRHLVGIVGIIVGKRDTPNTYVSVLRTLRARGIIVAVPDLDRYHPAVTTLAALADVDARTALAWLEARNVKPRLARRLVEAIPRARVALPEHDATYAARVTE